jgi:hypothetical protein
MRVHSALGPGLLESAYEACLHYELTKGGLRVEAQKPLPLVYQTVKLECGYRVDLLVESKLIIRGESCRISRRNPFRTGLNVSAIVEFTAGPSIELQCRSHEGRNQKDSQQAIENLRALCENLCVPCVKIASLNRWLDKHVRTNPH